MRVDIGEEERRSERGTEHVKFRDIAESATTSEGAVK